MDFLARFYAEILMNEPEIDIRTKAAKEKAERIVEGKLETMEDLISRLKFLLSQHYRRPFSDPFWDEHTLDELLLEVFLINTKETPKEQRAAEQIRDNADELVDDLFAGLGDIAPRPPTDTALPEPELTPEEESFINNQGKAFMENGFQTFANQQGRDNEE
jgi:hypothetical protein